MGGDVVLAFHKTAPSFIQAAVTLLFASVLANAATITVTPDVTLSNGLYHYAYSITNNTPDDAFLIDIPVAASPSSIENLTAPSGFMAAFDSGLGLVSFLENSSVFSSTPESGFSFDSLEGPGSVLFEASVFSNSTSLIYTVSGATLAPVPEPRWLPALGLLAPLCLLVFGRGRQARVCLPIRRISGETNV
jgi:hypothetical protein